MLGRSRDQQHSPMTLGQAAAAQVRLIVWCKGCNHQAEPDVSDQVARYGAALAVPEWAARLRSSVCGGSEIDFVVSGAAR
jgi:hypothetical protein